MKPNLKEIFPPSDLASLSKSKVEKQKFNALQKEFAKAMGLSEDESKKIDQEMKRILLSKKDNDRVKLLVALKRFDEHKVLYDELQMSTGVYSSEPDNASYALNGKKLSEKEVETHIKKRDDAIKRFLLKQNSKRENAAKEIHKYLKANKISSSLDKKQKNYTYFTVEMTAKESRGFFKNNLKLIRSVGLNAEHELSVAEAMIATRVDPVVLHWTPWRNNQRGEGIGIYFSDAQCNDAADVDGLYNEFDGTAGSAGVNNYNHTFLVAGVIASVAPGAFKYCKDAAIEDNNPFTSNFPDGYPGVLPTANEINNNIGPRIRVESYSINRNGDNSNVYTTEDSIFDEHVRDSNNIVFISTGNNSATSPSTVVESPAKGYNIVSVGNYDDATDVIANGSNFTNPNLGNEKPELVAPGVNISYEFNNRPIDNEVGTSFSAPHAAAIAADIMSQNPFLQATVPVIKAMMLASATDIITDVSNTGDSAVGAGGINVERGIYNDRFAAYWYDSSGNGPFSWSGPRSCYDGWTFSASRWHSKTRVALTWEIDENYVLQNNNHGVVLYFYVRDSSNNIVARSWSGSAEFPNQNDWQKDNWAVADFDPKHSNSNYTINVCRYNSHSSNTNSELNMAVAVTSK